MLCGALRQSGLEPADAIGGRRARPDRIGQQRLDRHIELGSGRKRVLRLVVREGAFLAVTGLAIGSIGAYFVGQAMQGFLFGIRPIDYPAFLLAGSTLLLTALIACLLPARRAASVEPMQALRME